MQEFQIENYQVHVFAATHSNSPVIYLHGMDGYALQIWPMLQEKAGGDLSLVTITLPYEEWSIALAPWSTPAGWPQYVACRQGAPAYLKIFLEKIIPQAESMLPEVSQRILAGYSLAGLFALWAAFETPLFDKLACASPSLWFPGFENWFFAHSLCRIPQCVYFSCSEEEYNSENEYLKATRPTLQAVEHFFEEKKVPTTLVLDQGNHYEHVLERTLAAILWCLWH